MMMGRKTKVHSCTSSHPLKKLWNNCQQWRADSPLGRLTKTERGNSLNESGPNGSFAQRTSYSVTIYPAGIQYCRPVIYSGKQSTGRIAAAIQVMPNPRARNAGALGPVR